MCFETGIANAERIRDEIQRHHADGNEIFLVMAVFRIPTDAFENEKRKVALRICALSESVMTKKVPFAKELARMMKYAFSDDRSFVDFVSGR